MGAGSPLWEFLQLSHANPQTTPPSLQLPHHFRSPTALSGLHDLRIVLLNSPIAPRGGACLSCGAKPHKTIFPTPSSHDLLAHTRGSIRVGPLSITEPNSVEHDSRMATQGAGDPGTKQPGGSEPRKAGRKLYDLDIAGEEWVPQAHAANPCSSRDDEDTAAGDARFHEMRIVAIALPSPG
ncbi:hypothetical protein VTI28DRAFT_2732 [Corynascus sepedonium]